MHGRPPPLLLSPPRKSREIDTAIPQLTAAQPAIPSEHDQELGTSLVVNPDLSMQPSPTLSLPLAGGAGEKDDRGSEVVAEIVPFARTKISSM